MSLLARSPPVGCAVTQCSHCSPQIDCMEREYEREMEQAQEEFDVSSLYTLNSMRTGVGVPGCLTLQGAVDGTYNISTHLVVPPPALPSPFPPPLSLSSSPPPLPSCPPYPPLPQTKKQELKECIVADLQEKQRVAEQERTSLDLAVGGCGRDVDGRGLSGWVGVAGMGGEVSGCIQVSPVLRTVQS